MGVVPANVEKELWLKKGDGACEGGVAWGVLEPARTS